MSFPGTLASLPGAQKAKNQHASLSSHTRVARLQEKKRILAPLGALCTLQASMHRQSTPKWHTQLELHVQSVSCNAKAIAATIKLRGMASLCEV